MPLVSLLIPAYNRESLIAATLQSALEQTVTDIEVIVVDNNSIDKTVEVALKFMERDPRVKVYKNDSNVGPVQNWIRCAQLASAPYGKILFSDDLIAKNYLQETLPHLIDPDCALVYTSALIGTEDWIGALNYNCYIGNTKILRETYIRQALYCGRLPVSPGAALFRTKDLLANIKLELPGVVGYDFSSTGAGVDWLLYMLTALNYRHVQYVDQPLSFFRAHPDSLTIQDVNGQVTQGVALATSWFKASLGLP